MKFPSRQASVQKSSKESFSRSQLAMEFFSTIEYTRTELCTHPLWQGFGGNLEQPRVARKQADPHQAA